SHLTRVFASRVVPLYHYRYEIRKQSRNAVMAWAMRTPEEKPAAPAATPASAGNWTRTPAQAGLTAPTAPNFANVSWPQSCGDLPRWLRNYKVGSLEAEALERLLKRCEAQQIAVVLVGVPVSGLHRSLYTPEIHRAFLDYMKQLTATYPCRFIDLRERVPDCCFCDHHHISQQGREYVSRLLAWEVVLPAWRELHERPANKSY